MYTRRLYFVVGITVALAAIAAYVLIPDSDRHSKHPTSDENPTTRTWRNAEIRRVSLDGDPWQHLFNPVGMEVYEDHVYVADLDDSLRIKRFTSDGHLVNTIGAGLGEGPGELKHIADYYVGDGEVWVADSRARNISRFTTDGTFLNRFNVEHHPLRVTSAGNHIAVLRIGPGDLFQVFDTTGVVKSTFGQLISNQSKKLHVSHWISCSRNG